MPTHTAKDIRSKAYMEEQMHIMIHPDKHQGMEPDD